MGNSQSGVPLCSFEHMGCVKREKGDAMQWYEWDKVKPSSTAMAWSIESLPCAIMLFRSTSVAHSINFSFLQDEPAPRPGAAVRPDKNLEYYRPNGMAEPVRPRPADNPKLIDVFGDVDPLAPPPRQQVKAEYVPAEKVRPASAEYVPTESPIVSIKSHEFDPGVGSALLESPRGAKSANPHSRTIEVQTDLHERSHGDVPAAAEPPRAPVHTSVPAETQTLQRAHAPWRSAIPVEAQTSAQPHAQSGTLAAIIKPAFVTPPDNSDKPYYEYTMERLAKERSEALAKRETESGVEAQANRHEMYVKPWHPELAMVATRVLSQVILASSCKRT